MLMLYGPRPNLTLPVTHGLGTAAMKHEWSHLIP